MLNKILNQNNLKKIFITFVFLSLFNCSDSNCIGNCVNGYGKKVLVVNNQITIKNVIKNAVVYEGNWQNREPEGKGTMIFSDGRKISGEWKWQNIKGYITITLADGNEFFGQWETDELDGIGKRDSLNANMWWDNGKLEGTGAMILNGKKYTGIWKGSIFIEDGPL